MVTKRKAGKHQKHKPHGVFAPALITDRHNAPPLITFDQVAKILSFKSRRGVQLLMARDENFPRPIKLGGTKQSIVRFKSAELFDWLDAQKSAWRARTEVGGSPR